MASRRRLVLVLLGAAAVLILLVAGAVAHALAAGAGAAALGAVVALGLYELRARRGVASTVDRVARASGIHFYRAQPLADGTWRRLVTSTNSDLFVGSAAPSGASFSSWWDDHIHPDDRARYDEVFATEHLTPGAQLHVDYRLVGTDGVIRTVVEQATVRQHRGRLVVEGVVRDVSEERAVATERDAARAELGRVIESLEECLYTVRCGTDGRWTTIWAGLGMERLIGAPAPSVETLDRLYPGCVHPDDRAPLARDKGLVAAGVAVETEYRVVGLDGVERRVIDRMRPRDPLPDGTRVADGIIIDVTEQHRAATALIEAERRLERAVAATGVHFFAGELGSDETWSEIFTGPNEDQFLGPPVNGTPRVNRWETQIHADDHAAYGAMFSFERLRSLEPASCIYRIVATDGSVRDVLEHLYPREVTAAGRLLIDGFVSDVSEMRRALRQAADAEERLRRVLEAVDELVYVGELRPDEPLEVMFTGPGMEALIGGSIADGASAWALWRSRIDPADAADVDRAVERLRRGESTSVTFRLRGLDGVTRWMWSRASPRPAEGGRVVVDGIVSDVSERQRAAEELRAARDEAERRSRVDALTGAYNRRHFVEMLQAELRRAARGGDAPGVVLIDIDNFKRVNDIYLHAAGDAVLEEVAARLHRSVREYDTVARWGGEEFAVLLPSVGDAESLRTASEKLRTSISLEPIRVGAELVAVTASAGATLSEPGSWSVEALVDAADRALYAAKRRGRNQLRLSTEVAHDEIRLEAPDAIRIAEAMSRSASIREGVPDLHFSRVADLAGRVAHRLALSPESHLLCRLAGQLHDVGKVAIPDRVLAKPGPLDADEWSLMRAHSAIGGDIVAGMPGVSEAAQAVRHHHERYDGSGYPDGLAGEAIPLEARIVATVDAYSAMTEDRVYRGAMSSEEAIAELRRAASTHLDPVAVEALCGVLEGEGESSGPGPERRAGTPASA